MQTAVHTNLSNTFSGIIIIALQDSFLNTDKSGVGNNKCGKGCDVCPHMKTGKTFIRNNEEITIKYDEENPFTCKTEGPLVYVIRCGLCSDNSGLLYVGSTSRKIQQRIREHKYPRENPPAKTMHEHFDDTCDWNNLQFMVIEKLPQGVTKRLLLYKEAQWIKRLQGIEFGWNDFERFNPYLRKVYGPSEEDQHGDCKLVLDECIELVEGLTIENSKLKNEISKLRASKAKAE